MKKSGIIQVRLDRELASSLAAQLKTAKDTNKYISESALVRILLRDAIAARAGRSVPLADQGFIEGWLRGYGKARRRMHEALSGKNRSRVQNAGGPR
ncbi:MAG: hypothetical protein JXP73_12140 [Deltaproteobacteria bacterium]|nr:hypothetical protein [Deltaproteobacteria bacterium]